MSWHKSSLTVADADQKIDTVSVYLDYDLRSWLFGVSFEPDPYWYDLRISFGPVGIAFTYWRSPAYLVEG